MQKILIIVLVVAVVALSGVMVYQKLNQPEVTPIVVNQPVATTSNEALTNAKIYEWKQFSDVLEKINVGAVSDIRADSIKVAIEGKLINKKIGMSISSMDYVDLDGDGKDEVVFNIYGGGTGGSYGALVYRLVISPTNSNYLANVEVDRSFKENLQEGCQGHMGFYIVGNQLMESFDVYQGPDPNCCPTGGIRFILFKWDSGVKKIVVNKVVNLDFTWYQKAQNGNFKVATDEAMRIFGINSLSINSGETAEWKIYRNEKYGYEIKYLPTMAPVVRTDWPDTTTVFSGNAISAKVTIYPEKYSSLEKFLEYVDNIQKIGFEGSPTVQVNNQKEITVGNYRAIQREQFLIAAGMPAVETYIFNNGTIFSVSIEGGLQENGGKDILDASNAMLSTFKFIK